MWPILAGISWDVPGCGDLRTFKTCMHGTSECGSYWLVYPGMSLVVGISGHVRRAWSSKDNCRDSQYGQCRVS